MRILIFILIFSFTNKLYSDSQFEIFGMNLLDSVKDHASYSEIQGSWDHQEAEGFFKIYLGDKTNATFDIVGAGVDKNYVIHEISAESNSEMSHKDCLTLIEEMIGRFKKKYSVIATFKENMYVDFSTSMYAVFDRDSNLFRIQCRKDLNNNMSIVQMVYQTDTILDAVDKFYDEGF